MSLCYYSLMDRCKYLGL
uniref:Uncharacterized protein n=1 Tax=Arundo donax TaxID=35708 RepID=A0A0A9SZT7_ARUDO